MKLTQLEYTLPESSIAHFPSTPRDHARLLVLNREKQTIAHKHFFDLRGLLSSNDVLVFNNTKVIPARLIAKKTTGGAIEIFLLSRKSDDTWTALHRGKLLEGQKLLFDGTDATVIKKENEIVTLQFNKSGEALDKFIDSYGHIPLPPYIHSKEKESKLRHDYQTVYAKEKGSVASPTAGLHFTKELIENLKQKGVQIEYVTLHVGLGTFMPIKETDITKHAMHSEYYSLDKETEARLNLAKEQGKRIIAVGTTTTRVLESQVKNGVLKGGHGETNIFIYPPYKFKFVDGLITNFHLPHSTLLALVSAFVCDPNTSEPFTSFNESSVGKAYEVAIDENYRFYSFGDGMLII